MQGAEWTKVSIVRTGSDWLWMLISFNQTFFNDKCIIRMQKVVVVGRHVNG